MRPCQGQRAVPGIARQLFLVTILDLVRPLPVPKLADVEVVRTPQGVDPEPPEELVARRLHEPLAGHDPLPVVLELALLRVGLQHRCLSLLELEEDRVALWMPMLRNTNASVPTDPTPTGV